MPPLKQQQLWEGHLETSKQALEIRLLPLFMMPLMDRMAWRKGSIQRAGSMVSPLRGLVPQRGPLVARLSRVREVEGYILSPLFSPQIESPQPEPSVFQLRLVQE